MPRRSQVATHPRRAEIEIGLAMGMQVKALAKKYGMDVQVLYRYKRDMPPSRKAAILAAHTSPGVDLDKLKIVESEGLLAHLIVQRGRCHEAIDLAIEYGDLKSWHLFEGETRPDVYIETPDLLVVIEGKRTEGGPTTSTKWIVI